MQDREIALDTETTGFEPTEGHRMVEVGAVEMINRVRTGKVFHAFMNPQRSMPMAAYEVHGLGDEFLADKPLFEDVADEMLAFFGDARLVIHNAKFDMKFLNAELSRAGKTLIPNEQAFCTLVHARKTFPGSPASLDALCKRFNIGLEARTKHGALLDAELLADMYLELMGGRQDGLALGGKTQGAASSSQQEAVEITREFREPRAFAASEEELAAHQAFLEKLDDPLWGKTG